MLVTSHGFQLHAKAGLMYPFVTQKAWWPIVKVDIDRHIAWCGLCSAKFKAARLAGHGMVSVCSLWHIEADHVCLPGWLKKLLKVERVLMIRDKASGKVAVEVAEHMTAGESAVLLFLGWI